MPGPLLAYLRRVAGSWQVLAWLLLLTGVAPAARSTASSAAPTHIAAELVVERAAAPGQAVQLAIAMTPAPGWHGYWLNPGDAGFGMTIDWLANELRDDTAFAAPRYPVPTTLLIAGLMNHVYDRPYAVLVTYHVPASAQPGTTIPITANAHWLACTEAICVPEEAQLSTLLTVAAPGATTPTDPRFGEWRRRLPAPLGTPARFAIAGDTLRLAIPLPASQPLEAPHVFAGTDRVVDYAAPQVFARQGDLLLVTLKRAKPAPLTPTTIDAVLRLDRQGDGLSLTAAPGPVPTGGTPLTGVEAGAPFSFGQWIGLLLAALAGGLLLNVMPCVFPILSLKALSLARAGGDGRAARIEGVAYTAGVMLACLALGALLLGLRAAGSHIGWAFQLQEPVVVVALALLAVAITANLAGLFEFAVPGFASGGGTARHGAAGAFATGLLAAFAATPCTGPFMAGAMGAALVLPLAPALALFAALGLGIALPFLTLAFVPSLRRLLPRPGAWMNTFRRLMALPMALTALALLWLASRLGGAWLAAAVALVALALVGLLAAIGIAQRRGRATPPLVWAGLVVVLAAAATTRLAVAGPLAHEVDSLGSRPFSESGLARARAAGHPVFAWFTADWCLSCKVNERIAIDRAETRDALKHAGVVVLKGDWTRRDPAITAYLDRMGAAGVPLYVWYPAGSDAPQILPQVLTPQTLPELAHKPH
jgi:thiol:disulfide interchange protein/DsbC/DsbD-like thiol-disulfide interchange protein